MTNGVRNVAKMNVQNVLRNLETTQMIKIQAMHVNKENQIGVLTIAASLHLKTIHSAAYVKMAIF